MRRTVSAAWIPLLRIVLVAIVTQPAAAALIHDTTLRYPVIGGIIAAVEGAAIAWSANAGKASEPEPTLGDYLAGVRRLTAGSGQTTGEPMSADRIPPAPPPPPA